MDTPPLIPTPEGWPHVCLARGDAWVFGPEASYERHGDVDDVTFPCGYTIGADGDALHLDYGAADSRIALATGSVRELLGWLAQSEATRAVGQ